MLANTGVYSARSLPHLKPGVCLTESLDTEPPLHWFITAHVTHPPPQREPISNSLHLPARSCFFKTQREKKKKKKAGGSGKQEAGFLEGHLGFPQLEGAPGRLLSHQRQSTNISESLLDAKGTKNEKAKERANEKATESIRPGHVAATQHCPAGSPRTCPAQVVRLSSGRRPLALKGRQLKTRIHMTH